MGRLRSQIDEGSEARRPRTAAPSPRPPATPIVTTGQSTQLIVGADDASDRTILGLSARLYGSYRLKRVYYSAFSPIPDASPRLPLAAPPLQRESRLYQADWLLRYYGFQVDDLAPEQRPQLALDIDPKLAWALAHPERFPVDVNRAERDALLRVPGFGRRAVERVLDSRRIRAVRLHDLRALGVPAAKALPFIVLPDHRPARDAAGALKRAAQAPRDRVAQLPLFG
jgi:predicted DNA-binding helix-hairpin-helix protein